VLLLKSRESITSTSTTKEGVARQMLLALERLFRVRSGGT
jgi:hypothetical protein